MLKRFSWIYTRHASLQTDVKFECNLHMMFQVANNFAVTMHFRMVYDKGHNPVTKHIYNHHLI